jgi:outer membrane biogenesis lipoprotein LolB
MFRLRLLFLLISVALFQAGCSSTPPSAPAADNVDANGNAQSSVPWNKPETWETTGQLGGMAQ